MGKKIGLLLLFIIISSCAFSKEVPDEVYVTDWQGIKKDVFTEDDSGIAFAFKYKECSDTHTFSGKWYYPNGTLYYGGSKNGHEYDKEKLKKAHWIGYDFNADKKTTFLEKLKANPGEWKIVVYQDNDYLTTLYFRFISISNEFLPEMVQVDGGTLLMGSTKGEADEAPVCSVTLKYDYSMGRYEITNKEYMTYLNETKIDGSGSKNGKELIDMDDGDCEIGFSNGQFFLKKGKEKAPVREITWWGAIGYCNWLSEKAGFFKAYDSSGNLLDKNGNITKDITEVEGYRLPTEAEWEYAARGGKESKGYTYSGSNSIEEVAWYKNNSGNATHVTGLKKANELGLYDMSGNLVEWCQDGYDADYYSKSPCENPVNLNSASERVTRGGYWGGSAYSNRITNRFNQEPSVSGQGIGFRVARTE